ncbi:hypothetical protein MY4038_007231 [Beauveria bassiana]
MKFVSAHTALLCGWLSTVSFAAPGSSCPAPPPQPDAANRGAVSSENAICSGIGTQLIKEGGNAVDALVGTVFCVGTVAMYHSGIGGGGFMLLRDKNGHYEFVDFRETAPAAAFQEMYKNNTDASLYGGLASGIPGELRGLEYVHKKYGVLDWATVMAPAIRIARRGFPVDQDLVSYIKQTPRNQFLVEDPNWAVDFAPNGKLLGLGETITRKRYADTLETIASEGADAFYTGAIARATIRALGAQNGTMTLKDLEDYTIAHRQPLHIMYRGHKLTSTNAPSSGPVALSALNTVSGYDDFFQPETVNISTHRLDEAIRFAYGQRTKLGDPSFIDGLSNYTSAMVASRTGAEIRARISDTNTEEVAYYNPQGIESLDTPGTSHIVAADASGMAVSLTTTINTLFGSRVLVPETGVLMNNEMNDFSIPGSSNAFGYRPSPQNYVRPGKRPLSSISPVIAETPEGKLYFACGSAGGSRITTATIQLVVHMLDQGMGAAESLKQPRLHDQLQPNQVTFEYAYDNSTTAFMKSLGHNVTWVAPGQSTAQALKLLANGTFEAGGEPRQKNSGGFAV